MVRQEVAMGDMMPYLLEKGGTFRLFEKYLNIDRAERRAFLEVVRNSYKANDLAGQLNWFVQGPPGLWNDLAFSQKPVPEGAAAWTGDQERDLLIEKWFGFERDASGQWVPHTSAARSTAARSTASSSTTGFWIAYEGEVHRILCAAIRWALELSLGLGPNDNGPGRDEPWPIELFWKCLAPWFEAWVVHRPTKGPGTGLVSVILVTPTHDGANVAESPIATSQTVESLGGRGVPSTGRDYEVLAVDDAPGSPAPLPAPAAPERTYGMWVVTHRDQIRSGAVTVDNNAADSDIADWGIPELGVYRGSGPIVVVSPSMAAGGIKHDGSV
jgi:hypothetical protein